MFMSAEFTSNSQQPNVRDFAKVKSDLSTLVKGARKRVNNS